MTATRELACPRCASPTLRSDETTVIGYSVICTLKPDGGREYVYTGERVTFDEGTEFADDLHCRSCGWVGQLAALIVIPAP